MAAELVNSIIDEVENLDEMPFRHQLYKDEPWHSKGLRYVTKKCDMRIVKEQLLQQYVIEAISRVGISDSTDCSDELVKNYIKKIMIFDDYVLVETIEL